MRHLFISFILATASMGAVAQNVEIGNTPIYNQTNAKAKVAPLTGNQRVIGEFDESFGYAEATFPSNGTKIASFISQEMLRPFIGCKVKAIRVRIADNNVVKSLFINEGNSISEAKEQKAEIKKPAGNDWQVINLDKDIEITAATKGFAVGYNLTNDQKRKLTIGRNYVKGNVYAYDIETNRWVNCFVSNDYTLAFQLIVEPAAGTNVSNLVFGHIETPHYAKAGGNFDIKCWLSNTSTETVNNFTIDVKVDGQVIKNVTIPKAIAPGVSNKLFTIVGPLPATVAPGKHQLSMVLTKINDKEVNSLKGIEGIHNIRIYNNVVERQKTLVEEFTSERCSNCYKGIKNIKGLESRHSDMVMVAVHINASNYPDDVAAPESESLGRMSHFTELPSFACNRLYFAMGDKGAIANPTIAQEPSTKVNELLDNFYDYSKGQTCNFVTLGIANKYDAAKKSIEIKVTGTGIEKAKEMLEDYALFVLVKEDDVDGHQGDEYGVLVKTKHQDVLRAYVTDVKGDSELEWNNDNFTKTYSINVKNGWNAEKMEVVAFIAPKISEIGVGLDDLFVQNCVEEPVVKNTNGIENISTNDNAKEVEYYNINGQRIAKPESGVCIVKLSNGKVVKRIIK